MDAYVYQAALLCEDCAKARMAKLSPAEDSDDYPQGPYADGGGEADCPQHCDDCQVFLENPLTLDGYAYVTEAIEEHKQTGRGNADILALWMTFYDLTGEEM